MSPSVVSSATQLWKPPDPVQLIFLNLESSRWNASTPPVPISSFCRRGPELYHNHLWGLFNVQILRVHPDPLSDFTGNGTQCLHLVEAPRWRLAALTNPSLHLARGPRLPGGPPHQPALGDLALPSSCGTDCVFAHSSPRQASVIPVPSGRWWAGWAGVLFPTWLFPLDNK